MGKNFNIKYPLSDCKEQVEKNASELFISVHNYLKQKKNPHTCFCFTSETEENSEAIIQMVISIILDLVSEVFLFIHMNIKKKIQLVEISPFLIS